MSHHAYPRDRSHEAAELRATTMDLARRLRTERRDGSLSANKLIVLGHLYRGGPSSPGQLAEAEHQQPQSLTRVFAELERAGLVSRAVNERDRRESILTLTQAGADALAADMAQRDDWLEGALAELSETEVSLLMLATQLMRRLGAAIG